MKLQGDLKNDLWKWIEGRKLHGSFTEKIYNRFLRMSLGNANILYKFMLANFPGVDASAFVRLEHIYYYRYFEDLNTKNYYERNKVAFMRRANNKLACYSVLSHNVFEFCVMALFPRKWLANSILHIFVNEDGYELMLKKCNKLLMDNRLGEDIVNRLKNKLVLDSISLGIKKDDSWIKSYE